MPKAQRSSLTLSRRDLCFLFEPFLRRETQEGEVEDLLALCEHLDAIVPLGIFLRRLPLGLSGAELPALGRPLNLRKSTNQLLVLRREEYCTVRR